MTEIAALIAIAAPLCAAHLAELAMFITTKIAVGRLGYLELAAVGLAGEITFEILVVVMGLLSMVSVFVAQADGRGRREQAGHAARQGLVLAALLAVPVTALVWNLTPLLALTGQDPRVLALTAPYLHALSGSILPMFLFAALRFALSALARTGRVMVITVAAVGLNYLLAMGLVHGRFGLPALGAPGAGWATTLVSWLMLGGLLVSLLRTPALAAYGLLRARLRIDVRLCAEIARLGIPVAGVVVLESGLFMAVSILSGAFGATALAAFQVLMGWIGIAFVIALGLAEGTMVRVALGMGRGSLTEARRAGLVGIGLGVALLGALVAVPLGVPELIVALFLQRSDPGYDEVARLVTGLLLIVALFQVFDAVQAIASRALRGMKDTVVPLLLAGFGYWVLGIGGGCTLAFPLGLQTHGLWWGTAAGLTVTGLLLAGRFVLLTRPRAPATPPGRAPARDQ